MNNPYSAYLESRILSASPVDLVRMLCEAAVQAVRSARSQLAAGDIPERARSISKAVEILTELSSSLDHGSGGDLSARLAALYDYMQRRLLAANYEQKDAPLAETLGLLETLLEAWKQVNTAEAGSAAPGAAVTEAPACAGMPVMQPVRGYGVSLNL